MTQFLKGGTMRKTLLFVLLVLLAISSLFGATVVTARPSQIDISGATSESAVLMDASAYTSDDARYRLYNGSNQYNCWDTTSNAYITSTSYASGPQVPGTPTTSSTWWIVFQRGNNATTVATYRDRLNPYTSNNQTVALPTAAAITTPFSITNANVSFTGWTTFSQKYVILAYDATTAGTLISATSSALDTGAFDLKVETGTTIRRLEVRSLTNALISSATGTWTAGAPTPSITVNPTSLTGFSYIVGAGPSAAQSFTVSGSNLTANISLTSSTNYEISLSSASGYTTPITLTQTGGTVASTTIYVRLKSGLAAGDYNAGLITASSTGATNQTVSCTGTVNPSTPTITLSPATLSGFTYVFGAGPSTAQSFTASGINLTANISIAAPTNYEISLTSASGYTTPIVLAHTAGTVASTTIYVRLKSGLAVADYNAELVTATSTGATAQTVSCSGSVTAPVGPTTFMEENFNYVEGTTLVSNGWVAHSGAGNNSPTVASAGLAYTGYFAASGLSGQTLGNGEDVHKNFTPQTSGSVYNSFLINISSVSEAGDYAYMFATNVDATTDFKGRLFVGRDATNNVRFGLTKSAGLGTAVAWTGYNYALNTTYLVVMKYQIIDGATNDIVTAWINPTIGATEPAAMLTASATETDIGTAGIGSVAIRQSSTTPVARFDGIRVTNDWATLWSGTPPPTPVIGVVGELAPFACYVGQPSDEIQSYTLNGTDIQGSITITPPAAFQVSLTGTDGWENPLNVSGSYPKTIYVRMLAYANGTYEGNIVHSSTGAVSVNLPITGDAFNPSVVWNIPASLTAFSTEAGTPSTNLSYNLSATNATGDITVTTTAPFEISTTGTGNWLTSLTLPFNYNANIYVRMNSAAPGTFNGTINHNTADASEGQVAVSGTATPQAGMAVDLFFSEYIEGNSNNKALEIFNGTGAPVDLSNYKVELYANGAATPGNTLVLSGTLAHGAVYVIANAGANAAILALANTTSTVTYFNGDDAIALKKISTDSYVDIFGVLGSDPGSEWTAAGGYSTLNKTLVRKPTVIQGITVNPTASVPTPLPTDFVTLGTEWLVYDVDTIDYLGSHTFNPTGGEMAATPTFTPDGGVYFTAQNVTIATATVGATIRYTTDGSTPTETSTLYTAPVAISTDTTLKAIAFMTGYTPSAIATAVYNFPHDVANIAALRAGTPGTTVYRLTGEAVLTFQQATRNQKYIQDSTGAILIDDATGIITTPYALYDGITRISGTLSLYNGLLQFLPVADPGIATSHNNVVVPEVRTLASLTSADQAKLIKVLNVTFDATTVTFQAIAENINVTDPTATLVLRTFPATDYSGTAIPTEAKDLVCLVGQYNTTMQVGPRFLADFLPATGFVDAPNVTITHSGSNVTLTWAAVAGATTYRIESSDEPYSGFTSVTTTSNLTWSGASAAKKFFRVIAIQ
jgi:hypothetical protein